MSISFQGRKVMNICLIMVLSGCVEPISIQEDIEKPKVVIDAYFTTEAELNSVRVTNSAGFSNNYPFVPFNTPISGATVRVYDNDGTQAFEFTEISFGLYKTEAAAETGKSYYLEVVLPGNAVYHSTVDRVQEAVEIDSLSFVIERQTSVVENAGIVQELQRHYFNVHVSLTDPPGIKNYYLWRAHGVFEYITVPPGDAPCEYCYCYAPLYPLLPYVNVMSDRLVDSGKIYQKVASIRFDRKTSFLTKLFQFSISPEAFKFWNSIHEQQTSSGSIFDPMPSQILGNIYNINDPEEQVLGFFTTAAVTKKNLLIKRGIEAEKANVHEASLLPIEVGDCRPKYAGSTHIRPIEFYD